MLRGIGRNRRRSLSTILGVVLSLTLILVSWGMLDTIQILMDRQYEQIEQQDAQLFLSAPLDSARLEEIKKVDGVARAEPTAQLAVSGKHGDKLYATDLFAFERDTQMHEFLTGGGARQKLPSDGILVGTAVKGLLGVSEGDEISLTLSGLDATVKTKVEGFVDEPLGTFMYSSLAHLAKLVEAAKPDSSSQGSQSDAVEALAAPGIATVMVRYDDGVDLDTMRRRLSELPDVAAFVDSRELFETVKSFMSLFYVFVGMMLAFGAVMAFSLIFNTMSANLAERSVEIATLRANGLSRGRVARILTSENLLLTAFGIVPGLIIGYWLAGLMLSSFSSDLFQFNLEMRGRTLVLSALAIFAVTVLSLWPGLRAVGRLDIATVARERSQ